MKVFLLLAMILPNHPAPDLVRAVYDIGGLEYVALVSCENPKWIPDLVVPEKGGHTSYGLPMVDDQWWEQHRGDLLLNLVQGWHIYRDVYGRDPARYNGGDDPGAYSIAWGHQVRLREWWLRERLREMMRVRAQREIDN